MFNETQIDQDLANFLSTNNYTREDLIPAFLNLFDTIASQNNKAPTETEEAATFHDFLKFCHDNTMPFEALIGQSVWFQILLKTLTPTALQDLARDNLPLSSLIKDLFKTLGDGIQAMSNTPATKETKIVDGVEVPRYVFDFWRTTSPGSKFLFKLLIGVGAAHTFEPLYRAAGGLFPHGHGPRGGGGAFPPEPRPTPLTLMVRLKSVVDFSVMGSPSSHSPPPLPHSVSEQQLDSSPSSPGSDSSPRDASGGGNDGGGNHDTGGGAAVAPTNPHGDAYMSMAIYFAEIAGRMTVIYSETKQDNKTISFHELTKKGISEGGPKGLITSLTMSLMESTGLNGLSKLAGAYIAQLTAPILGLWIGQVFGGSMDVILKSSILVNIGRITAKSVTKLSNKGYLPPEEIMAGAQWTAVTASGIMWAGQKLSLIAPTPSRLGFLIPSLTGVAFSYYMFPGQPKYYSSNNYEESYTDIGIAATENIIALAICLNGASRLGFGGAKKIVMCEAGLIGGSNVINLFAGKVMKDLFSMVLPTKNAFCKYTGPVCKTISDTATDTTKRLSELKDLIFGEVTVKETATKAITEISNKLEKPFEKLEEVAQEQLLKSIADDLATPTTEEESSEEAQKPELNEPITIAGTDNSEAGHDTDEL